MLKQNKRWLAIWSQNTRKTQIWPRWVCLLKVQVRRQPCGGYWGGRSHLVWGPTHHRAFKVATRSGGRWHVIANPHASGRNCPCTTQHSFKQPGKILLVCYSTHHSLQFDMPHDHVVRNLIFNPTPSPKFHPKGCSWGHKVNPVQYVLHLSLLNICAHFRIKIFKIDFEIGNC